MAVRRQEHGRAETGLSKENGLNPDVLSLNAFFRSFDEPVASCGMSAVCSLPESALQDYDFFRRHGNAYLSVGKVNLPVIRIPESAGETAGERFQGACFSAFVQENKKPCIVQTECRDCFGQSGGAFRERVVAFPFFQEFPALFRRRNSFCRLDKEIGVVQILIPEQDTAA